MSRIVLAEIRCLICGVLIRLGASIYPSGDGKVRFCPMCKNELSSVEVTYDDESKTDPPSA